MKNIQLSIMAILLLFCPLNAFAQAATIPDAGRLDLNAFPALSRKEKAELIISLVDARDRALQNVRYQIKESQVNISKIDKSRTFASKFFYELRRKEDKYWMEEYQFEFGKEDGRLIDLSSQNWDGKQGLSFRTPPFAGMNSSRADMTGEMPTCFGNHRFQTLIGFQIEVDFKLISLKQWVRDALLMPATTIDVVGEPNNKLVLVTTTDRQYKREACFDPAHGFMLTRFDKVVGRKELESRVSCADPILVDNVWMPKRSVGSNTTHFDKVTTVTTHDLVDCHFNNLQNTDIEIVYPVGTFVTDAVRLVAYYVLPDGKKDFRDLYVPGRGIIPKKPELE